MVLQASPLSLERRGGPLPTADVGYQIAQLGGQLSGGETVHPAVAGRPKGAAGAFLGERPVDLGI